MKKGIIFLLLLIAGLSYLRAEFIYQTAEVQITAEATSTFNHIWIEKDSNDNFWLLSDSYDSTNNTGKLNLFYKASDGSWEEGKVLTHTAFTINSVSFATDDSFTDFYLTFVVGTDLYFMTSEDAGETFSQEELLASNVSMAEIIYDETNKKIYLSYIASDGTNQQVYFITSSNQGKSFSAPVQITSDATNKYGLRMILDQGVIYLSWYNDVSPHRMEGVVSLDQGQTFGDGVTAGNIIQYVNNLGVAYSVEMAKLTDYKPVIAYEDFNNDVYCNWIEESGGVYQVDGSKAKKLATFNAPNQANTFKIKPFSDGNVMLFMTNFDGISTYTLEVYYLTGEGSSKIYTFPTDTYLANPAFLLMSDNKNLIEDKNGNLHLVYLQKNDTTNQLDLKEFVFYLSYPDDSVTGNVADGDKDFPIDSPISVTFGDELLESTINSNNVKLYDSANMPVSGSISYSITSGSSKAVKMKTTSSPQTTITFTPDENLASGNIYTLKLLSKKVDYPDGLQNKDGVGLNDGQDLILKFTTAGGDKVYKFETMKAYPNPATNGNVTFRMKTSFDSDVNKLQIDIFDVNERKVATITNFTDLGGNEFEASWDTTDDKKMLLVSNGIYYYRVVAFTKDGDRRIEKIGKILIIR